MKRKTTTVVTHKLKLTNEELNDLLNVLASIKEYYCDFMDPTALIKNISTSQSREVVVNILKLFDQ